MITLKNIKTAAKELNIAKGKIKSLIKNKEIVYTLENGHYMVDVEVIKNVLSNPKRAQSKYERTLNFNQPYNEIFNEYVDITLSTLLTTIEKDWKNNVRDTDIALVFRRTLMRNKQYLSTNDVQLFLLEEALKLSDEEIYTKQIILCEELGIKAFDIKKLNLVLNTYTSSDEEHNKSAHSVNGHFRMQPYGPRNNPSYKKIWIEEFDKGDKLAA